MQIAECISRIDIPGVALSHGLGDQRTGDSEGTVGHGDVTGGRDTVGVATVGDGSGLGAVGGVLGDSLSDVGGQGTGGQGESSDREAHIEWLKKVRGMFEKTRGRKEWLLTLKNVIGREVPGLIKRMWMGKKK